jgi:hypothetical protein
MFKRAVHVCTYVLHTYMLILILSKNVWYYYHFRHVAVSQWRVHCRFKMTCSNTAYFDNFTCIICSEVLQEPVQCVKNEHYFCKNCITKHLKRSQTCPLCQDNLTLETLRPIPRAVANILEQFQSQRCRYASRGCTSAV